MRTYLGGCHCGAVRFAAALDLARGTSKCNCSICTKARLWTAQIPADQFTLIAGQLDLTDYRGQNQVAHHFFCRNCGVHPFERIDMPNMSGAPYISVNVACLDGLDIDELMAAPITYSDGKNNAWDQRPAEVRHL